MVNRELASIVQQRPVLWVGAGLSVAAGYPGTSALLSAMRAAAPCDLPDGDFTQVVDAFIEATSPGELGDLLQRLFQAPHEPTAMHGAIARLAAAGRFTALVTTNYDDLLEVALRAVGVKVVAQTLEGNAEVREQDGALRLIKLHGSYTAWHDVILSGRSYRDFEARYIFLREQLDVLLQQYPLLFTGCSLQDPRVLRWIESRPPEWLQRLKRWRALLQPAAWAAAQDMTWNGGKAAAVLARVPLRPIEYSSHAELPALWLQLAKELAPLAVRELVFDLHPGEHEWRSVGPTTEFAPHTAPNPLGDDTVLRDLRRLRMLMRQPILIGEPQAKTQEAELRNVAGCVGKQLADTLLSPAARDAVRVRMAEVDRGTARLTLRIAEGPLADSVLALPWELLVLEDGRFAVEHAELDVVRDAVKPGAPVLEEPSAPLSVAATIAAPEDQTALRYEDESYRMLKALTQLGQIVHFAELGELDDLVELVRRVRATVVHFSGHGLPGALVFEDELGLSRRVSVTDLLSRLRQRVQASGVAQAFPRLFYLGSCHGLSATVVPAGNIVTDARTVRDDVSTALGQGPSTAATLHREGFACVIGYFGPIGDVISTSAEVGLYTALSEGSTVLDAVKQARPCLAAPHEYAGQRSYYPLGWAQLAVYLRGPDRPLTARPRTTELTAQAPPQLVRELIEVSGLPVLEHGFIGRRALQHVIRRKLKAGQRLFVLQGLGGLGKTALASQILCKVLNREPADQLIFRIHDETDVAELRQQAENHGDIHQIPGWNEEIEDLHKIDLNHVEGFRQTVIALRRHRSALVLYADNVDALQVGPSSVSDITPGSVGSWKPGIEHWWTAMESLAQGGIVLASTRYRWDALEREALISLDRMSRADLWRMLDTFPVLAKLPPIIREQIVDSADGRPRTVELLGGVIRDASREATNDDPDDWMKQIAPIIEKFRGTLTADILLDQLWRRITQSARDHACALSVLDQPAPLEVVEALGKSAQELINVSLLTYNRTLTVDENSCLTWRTRWSMHASVREFASAWAENSILHNARTQAARTYEKLIAENKALQSDQIEAINLYFANGNGGAAWPLALNHVLWLRRRARYGLALHLLERFTTVSLQDDTRIEFTTLRAQIQGHLGVPDEQTADLLRVNATQSSSPTTKSRVLHELGSLLGRQGKYSESELTLREALMITDNSMGRDHAEYGITLQSLGTALCKQGKYLEAASLLREALPILERSVGSKHPEYGSAVQNLAYCLSNLGEYVEAVALSQQALGILERALGRKHPDVAASLHTLGSLMIHQGKHNAAEGYFREALSIEGESLGDKHHVVSETLHSLAEALLKQGKYQDSEEILNNVLATKEKLFGRHHPSYSATLRQLAEAIYLQGQFEDGERLLRQALSLQEASLRCEHPAIGSTLQQLATVLSKRGKLDEAEGLLRKALLIQEGNYGVAHREYGACLHLLAEILSQRDRRHEAERLYRHALAVIGSAQGHEHPDYGAALHSLANILTVRAEYTEADRLFRESISILRRTLGCYHPDYGNALHNLANLQILIGKYNEGEELYIEILSIHLKSLGQDHPTYGITLAGLASVYVYQGNHEKALRLFQDSLNIIEATFGKTSRDYCAILHNLGNLLAKMGKLTAAEAVLRKSLYLHEAVLGCEHTGYGDSLHELAGTLSMLGRGPESESLLRRAISIKEKTLGPTHPSCGASHHELAVALLHQSKYAEAEPYLRSALSIAEDSLGNDHPSLCPTLVNLAFVVIRQGRSHEGPALAKRAIGICRAAFDDNHPSVQQIYAFLRAINLYP